ncbi:hypothetical protein QE152_g36204 [Popillia japonica]|uniref:Polyprotein n=1 Tax=Popillia japonica TaxID=7064 RepID=A0AAW1ID21_POPJA
MDAVTAFLQGDLAEEIYMEQPDGYDDGSAQSDGYRARSKHINVRHHFIRERVEDHAINIMYVPTQEMVADSLTKAVHKGKAQFCAIGMGLVDSNETQH